MFYYKLKVSSEASSFTTGAYRAMMPPSASGCPGFRAPLGPAQHNIVHYVTGSP